MYARKIVRRFLLLWWNWHWMYLNGIRNSKSLAPEYTNFSYLCGCAQPGEMVYHSPSSVSHFRPLFFLTIKLKGIAIGEMALGFVLSTAKYILKKKIITYSLWENRRMQKSRRETVKSSIILHFRDDCYLNIISYSIIFYVFYCCFFIKIEICHKVRL